MSPAATASASETPGRAAAVRRLALAAAAALLLAVAWAHLAEIRRAAVAVPFWDEWEAYAGRPPPGELTLAWLAAPHNEHVIAPTRLITWVMSALLDLDQRQQILASFGLYMALVAAWIALGVRVLGARRAWLAVLTALPLLTPRLHENHAWAFQSSFHFALLFHVLACACLFSARQRPWQLAAGAAFAVLGTYSLAASVATGAVTAAAFVAYKLARRELLGLTAALPIAAAVAAGILRANHLPGHPEWSMPWTLAFWDYLLALVSHGFGVDRVSREHGLFWLVALAVPLIGLARRARAPDGDAATPALLGAIALGVLAALASITLGRAGFGVTTAKTSRYAEIAIMLVPVAALAWIRLGDGGRRQRLAALALLAGLGFAFRDDWDFHGAYQPLLEQRLAGRACIEDYYLRGGAGVCPTLHPAPLGPMLDAARSANARLYRDIMAADAAAPRRP